MNAVSVAAPAGMAVARARRQTARVSVVVLPRLMSWVSVTAVGSRPRSALGLMSWDTIGKAQGLRLGRTRFSEVRMLGACRMLCWGGGEVHLMGDGLWMTCHEEWNGGDFWVDFCDGVSTS